MALTGLFLIVFLIIHLIGNFQLLKTDDGMAFNIYAKFMTSNPVIKTVSYLLYASILIHAIWALILTIQNRKARGSEGYAVIRNSSHWTSRSMGILGTMIFIFLVVHLRTFWYEMHWGVLENVEYDGEKYKNLYLIVKSAYAEIGYVIFYIIAMAMLGFHLWHGFSSAFQTLGLNHIKYNPAIKFVGRAFSIIVPALFALIPIWMFLF